jgi:hypothetical protein
VALASHGRGGAGGRAGRRRCELGGSGLGVSAGRVLVSPFLA